MKKKAKRLSLARETVRRLAAAELKEAVGAVHSTDCMTGDCLTAETPCDPSFTVSPCDTDAC
ncbi:MAG TPA: hypothetical protein VIA62_06620 [Thermoanaerobaculia bacterium]|jgi:hypothetical protein|nr:hypothetical protein [Thermoanaerobaculia bacterium]